MQRRDTTNRSSSTGADCADFGRCYLAICEFDSLLRQHRRPGRAASDSQVFQHLAHLRQFLLEHDAPPAVLSRLHDCRERLRSAASPKRRRLGNRLRNLSAAGNYLQQAFELVRGRLLRCQVRVTIIIVTEITRQHGRNLASGQQRRERAKPKHRRKGFPWQSSSNGAG